MERHPAWYGSVMGTGALALALSVQSVTWGADWLRWGSQVFLVVASVLAVVLLPAYAARLRSRAELDAELADPAHGAMLATMPAGLLVLATAWGRVGWQPAGLWVDGALLVAGTIIAIALGLAWSVAMLRATNGLEGVNGGWLIPPVMNLRAGTGDNMAAALGVGAEAGDVVVSIGTSGTVFAATEHATSDPSGVVAGFADASGGFLPLVCTLNASRVLDAACSVLGVGYAQLDELALSVADSGGLVLVPYLEGERTPNLPDATGSLHGLTRANSTPAYFARAAIEGMLCGLAAGMQALTAQGVPCRRVLLIGGGAQSPAVGRIAGEVFGTPVVVPEPGEYVAAGAARQAAWALTGQLPDWDATNCPGVTAARVFQTESRPEVLERYSGVQEQAFPTTL